MPARTHADNPKTVKRISTMLHIDKVHQKWQENGESNLACEYFYSSGTKFINITKKKYIYFEGGFHSQTKSYWVFTSTAVDKKGMNSTSTLALVISYQVSYPNCKLSSINS